MKSHFNLLLIIVVLYVAACSTYPTKTQDALNSFYSGDFKKTSELLDKPSQEDSKDQLLYLLDRGMALELEGDHRTSEKEFNAADQMSEVKDYVSLSTEAATLIVNDSIKQYKGEDFEKVLINAFLAIDYVLDGQYEDALVECRRVNNKLTRYRLEAKKNYEQNPFARYLSAMIWEATGKLEDAYIDYKETYKIEPTFPYVKADLIRLSKYLERDEDYREWKKTFGDDVDYTPMKEMEKKGEVVMIYQQGRSAIKKPNPQFRELPKFFPRASFTKRAKVEVLDTNNTDQSEMTEKIYSVSDVAIKTLNDAYAGLIAKRVAGIGTKAVIADQVRQKNQLLGALTWIGLNAVDQVDLRHWSTLPETLQIARILVPPGLHKVKITGLDASGNPSGEAKEYDVNVASGQKVFLSWRSLR